MRSLCATPARVSPCASRLAMRKTACADALPEPPPSDDAASGHPRPGLEFGALMGARLQHLAQGLRRVEDVDETGIERREAEAQNVGGAEIADHAARDHRLHHCVALWMAETHLAAAPCRIARGDQFQHHIGTR